MWLDGSRPICPVAWHAELSAMAPAFHPVPREASGATLDGASRAQGPRRSVMCSTKRRPWRVSRCSTGVTWMLLGHQAPALRARENRRARRELPGRRLSRGLPPCAGGWGPTLPPNKWALEPHEKSAHRPGTLSAQSPPRRKPSARALAGSPRRGALGEAEPKRPSHGGPAPAGRPRPVSPRAPPNPTPRIPGRGSRPRLT